MNKVEMKINNLMFWHAPQKSDGLCLD